MHINCLCIIDNVALETIIKSYISKTAFLTAEMYDYTQTVLDNFDIVIVEHVDTTNYLLLQEICTTGILGIILSDKKSLLKELNGNIEMTSKAITYNEFVATISQLIEKTTFKKHGVYNKS